MKFTKQQKKAAAEPQKQPLATSINSDIDALAMSYNDEEGLISSSSAAAAHVLNPPPAAANEDETSEISMTDSEKQRVEVVQRTSFISPMERKKRALERQRSMEAGKMAKNTSGNNDDTQSGEKEQKGGGGEVATKSSSVSSSIAKFNETFGKQETKRSFNESLTKKVDAVLHKKDSKAEVESQEERSSSILSADIPPTLSEIEAAVTVPAAAAQDPETTVETTASSSSSPLPPESDREKAKRAAIQQVMKDSSLSPLEKNAKVQQIIRGNFEGADVATTTTTATATATAAAVFAGGPPTEDASSYKEEEDDNEEEEDEDTSSGEYETSSGEEESSSGEEESSSGEEESSSGEEESSSGEEESSSGEEESTVVIVEPLKTVPEESESSVGQSTATGSVLKSAAVEWQKTDLESKLDKELENHHALEKQHEQRQTEFRAEQERLRKAEAAEAERLRLLEEERLRLEREQQAAESERRRRLEEDGQRALELVQRRLQEDREQQKALARQQEERRQYEEHRRQLEEEQRRLEAEREHQQILERQQEQMFQLQEEQRRLEEQRIQLEEGQRRLREERVREQVQVSSRAVGNVDRATTTSSNTRSIPRSSANKTISSSLPGGQRSCVPPQRVAPVTSTSQQNTRYDGVDDDELNWRLDSYAMLSDYTIVVRRALPGPHAPDFEVDDANAIEFAVDSGTPKSDVYYVHKAMIAVGSRRSELLGRRIREAESTSRPDGHSSDVNVHETIMLESAADVLGIVLDFLYYPDQSLEINIHNAVPLVYLGKRYKIRALIEQSEEFVLTHLESSNAIHFLLDSYLYQLDDILSRSIDVTAATLGETSDFNPIYKLPPELFRRIILSKDLNCDSELLSLIVYSYCGEHHAEDIDVEYLRELTKQRLMPDIDSKVALMLLKFYVELIFADDENCDIMDVLKGDNLMQRCIAIAAKHWQDEVYEPLMVDSEWNVSGPKKRLLEHDPTAIHRALPSELQNHLLEKCIIEAKHDFDSERAAKEAQQGEKQAEVEAVTKSFDLIVRDLQSDLKESEKNKDKQSLKKHINMLEGKMLEMEAELEIQKKEAEAYKQELKRFRRVPGIHNFGEVCKKDPNVVDKTKCTYSANPDHHYPLHRRGDRPPTQMPTMMVEFENLAKENGYVYDDGHGELLPVFYYVNNN